MPRSWLSRTARRSGRPRSRPNGRSSTADLRAALAEAARRGTALLLDAATGTELTRRGADTSPPLWSARALFTASDLVRSLHEEELRAGAEVLTAATFRTHRRNLARVGRGAEAAALTRRAFELAREAVAKVAPARHVFVAGSLAPLEDCYSPRLVPGPEALEREHREQAQALFEAGADFLLVETMGTSAELLAAARAAAETGLPCVASAVTDGSGRLLSGERLEEVVERLLALPTPPLAIGVNCVPARRLGAELGRLRSVAPDVPLVAYGNTGLPLAASGTAYTEPIEPAEYAAEASRWIDAGACLVGGCCGTGPRHTRALRELLDKRAKGERGALPHGK